MRSTVVIIPILLVAGGVLTSMMVPLPAWVRVMIFAGDCFAATAVGLILWRRDRS